MANVPKEISLRKIFRENGDGSFQQNEGVLARIFFLLAARSMQKDSHSKKWQRTTVAVQPR